MKISLLISTITTILLYAACGGGKATTEEKAVADTDTTVVEEKPAMSDAEIYQLQMDTIATLVSTYPKNDLIKHQELKNGIFEIELFDNYDSLVVRKPETEITREWFDRFKNEDVAIEKMILGLPVRFFRNASFLTQINMRVYSNKFVYEADFKPKAMEDFMQIPFAQLDTMKRPNFKKSFREPFLENDEKRTEFFGRFVTVTER